MAKRRKSGGIGRFIIVGVLVIGAAACAGYYGINRLNWSVNPPQQKPIVSITPSRVPAERTVYIYLLVQDPKGFHLSRTAVTTSERGSLMDAALDALLATNAHEGISAGLIPDGTTLVSPIEGKGHVAVVNLSQDFVDNFSGGSDQESATVNSIVHTVVYNSGGELDSVQILVEGKKVESLGGHFPLADPVYADSTLLKPGSLK